MTADQHVYLTDLDGTLLRSDASLSPFAIEALTEALNSGAIISYATARSFTSSIAVVSEVPWKFPIVLYNGAILYDPLEHSIIGGSFLDRIITNQIIELGRGVGLLPLLFALDDADKERVLHERLERDCDLQFYRSRPNDRRFREVDSLACPASHRTLILTYIGLYDELIALKEQALKLWGSVLQIHMMKDNYIEHHYFLEFSHPLANKEQGLKQWAKLVGCKPSEITVFGDNLNDKGMFTAAGTRIAVSNAHPDIIAMADELAGSNDDDGVAVYIKRSLKRG